MKKKITAAVLILVFLILVSGGLWRYLHSDSFRQDSLEKKQSRLLEKQSSMGKLEGSWTDASGEWDLEVWKEEQDLLFARITGEGPDGEMLVFSCSGKYSPGENGFLYYDGSKERVTYDMDGNSSEEYLYQDGSGKIFLKDKNLYWEDSTENAGKGLVFSYEGEY